MAKSDYSLGWYNCHTRGDLVKLTEVIRSHYPDVYKHAYSVIHGKLLNPILLMEEFIDFVAPAAIIDTPPSDHPSDPDASQVERKYALVLRVSRPGPDVLQCIYISGEIETASQSNPVDVTLTGNDAIEVISGFMATFRRANMIVPHSRVMPSASGHNTALIVVNGHTQGDNVPLCLDTLMEMRASGVTRISLGVVGVDLPSPFE